MVIVIRRKSNRLCGRIEITTAIVFEVEITDTAAV